MIGLDYIIVFLFGLANIILILMLKRTFDFMTEFINRVGRDINYLDYTKDMLRKKLSDLETRVKDLELDGEIFDE